VFVFRAQDDCPVGAFERVWSLDLTVSTKNSFSCPNKKQSLCALNTKITIVSKYEIRGYETYESILQYQPKKSWIVDTQEDCVQFLFTKISAKMKDGKRNSYTIQ
jgi:hypothetical protein